MANNTISQIEINNNTYDLLDANILNRIYPIGSIYMSVNSTSPASFIGGTWERIQDRFLLAAGSSYTAGATGGEATHKLTAAESGVPAHAHTVPEHGHGHSLKLPNHQHTERHWNTNNTTYQMAEAGLRFTSSGQAWVAKGSTTAGSTWGDTGSRTTDPVSLPAITGSVSNKAAFNTNNNTAANATNAHNNMPPYLAVYIWKRTA